MIPRLVQELARQRYAELVMTAPRLRQDSPHTARRLTLRSTVGWSIVAIGLRIAATR